MLSQESTSSSFQTGEHSLRGFHADNCAKGVLTAGLSFQGNSDEVVVVTDVVSEK